MFICYHHIFLFSKVLLKFIYILHLFENNMT